MEPADQADKVLVEKVIGGLDPPALPLFDIGQGQSALGGGGGLEPGKIGAVFAALPPRTGHELDPDRTAFPVWIALKIPADEHIPVVEHHPLDA
ncbi:hypothetical protein SDC9_206743 [bioreactor metagenome]|uniref:Uncharacterized protein n=1 Tax=bioreactor metagenome TaxID=1076179 RepID=A0A645J5M9_9ZZZZ